MLIFIAPLIPTASSNESSSLRIAAASCTVAEFIVKGIRKPAQYCPLPTVCFFAESKNSPMLSPILSQSPQQALRNADYLLARAKGARQTLRFFPVSVNVPSSADTLPSLRQHRLYRPTTFSVECCSHKLRECCCICWATHANAGLMVVLPVT